MNTQLTEPVVSPVTTGAGSVAGSVARTQPQAVVQPRARILYVDDDPQLRLLGKLVLVRSGYEVDTAADGAEAWTALQEVNYHLLITDNDMPRLTGLELASHTRGAGMRLPIVMTSGSPSPMGDPAHGRLDLAAFLSKPFASDDLVETVVQVLRAANRMHHCGARLISVWSGIANSIEPFPHGGINE